MSDKLQTQARECYHFDDTEQGFKQSVHPIEGGGQHAVIPREVKRWPFQTRVKHTRDMFKECVEGGGLNQLGVVLWRWSNDLFV